MSVRTFVLVCCLVVSPGRLLAQNCPPTVISQDSYVQIPPGNVGGNKWLFAYIPDIKTSIFGSSWSPFQLSFVEGIYGPPFPRANGSFSASAFVDLRKSRNVRITPVTVTYDPRARGPVWTPQQVVLAGQTAKLQIDSVRTAWVGADTVTLRICR